ncbi:hypothetical protein O3Q51_05315 [Cryomorphaceae bacterium 1068]|nr:hypothetical protein [Cryomorphaceae bacterium 1068]
MITTLIWFFLQILLESLGLSCVASWNWLIGFGALCSVSLPILFFYRHLTQETVMKSRFTADLQLFNSLEFLSLQISLVWLFAEPAQLCNSNDPQLVVVFLYPTFIAVLLIVFIAFVFQESVRNEY